MSGVFVAKDVAAQRRAICAACPFAGGVKNLFCTRCGCVIAGKVWPKGESCPEGKW